MGNGVVDGPHFVEDLLPVSAFTPMTKARLGPDFGGNYAKTPKSRAEADRFDPRFQGSIIEKRITETKFR